jgi:hypothetical protein
VNAIDRQYESYLGFPAATGPASPEAAAAVAAHAVLVAAFPSRAAGFDATIAFDLAQIPDGPEKAKGVEIGRRAAAAVLQRALRDETSPVPPYRPHTTPGVYVPTALPMLPMSAYVTRPWVLTSPHEVQPAPPPDLKSDRYARDYDEVKRLGGAASTERTAAQTAAAQFWAGNRTDLAARLLTSAPGRSLVANARFYALKEMALDDAGCASTVAKYDFAFWRPMTAIRNADADDNAQTTGDPGWSPLLQTPLFPEYPCGHCINAATNAAIFEAEFGPDVRLTFLDPEMPGAGRTLSAKEYVRDVSLSRIYAGVHYRFSNDAAEAMGWRIALKPLSP